MKHDAPLSGWCHTPIPAVDILWLGGRPKLVRVTHEPGDLEAPGKQIPDQVTDHLEQLGWVVVVCGWWEEGATTHESIEDIDSEDFPARRVTPTAL